MGIDVSYGVSKEYADNISAVSDVMLSDVCREEVDEAVFLKGRDIYVDMQGMMTTYNDILARDVDNIYGIAECMEQVDDMVTLDVVGTTRGE